MWAKCSLSTHTFDVTPIHILHPVAKYATEYMDKMECMTKEHPTPATIICVNSFFFLFFHILYKPLYFFIMLVSVVVVVVAGVILYCSQQQTKYSAAAATLLFRIIVCLVVYIHRVL